MTVKLGSGGEYDRNVRSDLADQIEKYWVGRTDSNIGLPYFDLENGKLKKSHYVIFREDIFCLQDLGRGVNVFVEIDGTYQVDLWEGKPKLTDDESKYIKNKVRSVMRAHKEYVERERRFLEGKPWERCYGKTPEEGVRILREWMDREFHPVEVSVMLDGRAASDLAEWYRPRRKTAADAAEDLIIEIVGTVLAAYKANSK